MFVGSREMFVGSREMFVGRREMFVGRRINLGSGSGELELVQETLLGRGILGMKSGERILNRRVKTECLQSVFIQ